VFHVSWSTKAHGARNVFQGEYDSALYFMLIVGLPVFWSCRGCIHVIDQDKIPSKERLQRVQNFAARYLQARWAGGEIQFPLRTIRPLKRLILYEWGLILCVILAALGIMAIWVTRDIRQWTWEKLLLLGVWGGLGLLSIPAIIAYFVARRPSQQQMRIRLIVATRLGPFSDPADWRPELIGRVVPDLGVDPPDAGRMLQSAEQYMKLKRYEDALILARMVLSLANSPGADDVLVEEKPRAESITEEALLHMGDMCDVGAI
jgi:hypothetical protein